MLFHEFQLVLVLRDPEIGNLEISCQLFGCLVLLRAILFSLCRSVKSFFYFRLRFLQLGLKRIPFLRDGLLQTSYVLDLVRNSC